MLDSKHPLYKLANLVDCDLSFFLLKLLADSNKLKLLKVVVTL